MSTAKKFMGLTLPKTKQEKIAAGVVGVIALGILGQLSPHALRQEAADINAKQFAEESRARAAEAASRDATLKCMVQTGVSEPFDRQESAKMITCLAGKGG